ncbi:MAG: TetR/AcrR family transcriptional regulator, partial [Sulfitobacter sp.]
MTGLRAKKKADTAQRIIEEASRSFETKGYDNTRIEDIAANTDLSVATFYNYFRSKADILLSSITNETEIVLAEAARCIEGTYDSVEEAFDALV